VRHRPVVRAVDKTDALLELLGALVDGDALDGLEVAPFLSTIERMYNLICAPCMRTDLRQFLNLSTFLLSLAVLVLGI